MYCKLALLTSPRCEHPQRYLCIYFSMLLNKKINNLVALEDLVIIGFIVKINYGLMRDGHKILILDVLFIQLLYII